MERQVWYLAILREMKKQSEQVLGCAGAESKLKMLGDIFKASTLSRDAASAIVANLREIIAALPASRDTTVAREYLEQLIRECDLERVS